jgi:hypothetical protein
MKARRIGALFLAIAAAAVFPIAGAQQARADCFPASMPWNQYQAAAVGNPPMLRAGQATLDYFDARGTGRGGMAIKALLDDATQFGFTWDCATSTFTQAAAPQASAPAPAPAPTRTPAPAPTRTPAPAPTRTPAPVNTAAPPAAQTATPGPTPSIAQPDNSSGAALQARRQRLAPFHQGDSAWWIWPAFLLTLAAAALGAGWLALSTLRRRRGVSPGKAAGSSP